MLTMDMSKVTSTEDSVQEGQSQDKAKNPRSTPSEGPKVKKMASPEARLSTYVSWPLRKMHPPEKLAEAGFIYLADGSSKVACFYSGMTITVNAGSYADPLEEHARCCHDCPFLLADHQKGPVLLQGTSEGTLKTRGPGKSKEDTQKTPETVRAPEQSSSQQFGTEGLAPTPSTNNSLGSTSSTCKQNEGENLALEPRATDQLALSCNDAAAPEAFDIQQAEIQSRAETAESTGSAEKVSSKATASEALDEIIRAKKEQLAGNTFRIQASSVVENIEEGSEKHKDIVSACVGSDKSEDILVSRHGANSTEFQADTNPETERYVTEGNLCIPPLATDDPYGQQLSTGAYRGNDQQTGDTAPASSKKASDKNIEDTHSNTGGVVKDITVSRTAVGGQHGAASSPTVTNQTRHEAVGTAIEKNVQCTDFYISSPATSLLHKDKLTVQNGQMCTEESPAGMVFDEQGIETAGASSLVSGAYADDFFKLPIQEQGESNTNFSSSTMNTARWQENHPPSPLGKREEDAGLSDTQKAKDSEPIYVTSDDTLWHPKCPLSTGVQPDASSSTICGRQQRISQKDHHQETCAVQVSVNRARQQEKPVSMQHTHSCSKHDQSEAARTQPSGSMPHHDSTQKHIASSHPQAPESALCSLNYLQERKDDAVPENWEDNNDSESDDEQAEDDLGTGGGGSSGDGNGDDDENHDGNDNNSGDGDEDEDDESDDGNDSSSSEDDGAEGAAPQDLIGYNIYAGVDIDIREATLPCLHCRVAEKQVQLPCSHRNLCFKCFFCKQFWRQHLLHGPPRCLLCEEEFTDIDDPFVFLLALAFNHRRQRRTNCGCGYRGG